METNIKAKTYSIGTSADILVVDDDQDFQWVTTALFSQNGYQVFSASNGEEALKFVDSRRPDVIILDLNMPGMDGWETFQALRVKTDAPVLILTGSWPKANTSQALQIGVNDLLTKPFQSKELLSRVEILLQRGRVKSAQGGLPNRRYNVGLKPTVSVIIPTRNEAKNLPLILPYLPMDVIDEVILVDGLSTDGTIEVARKIMPSIKVVIQQKPGKGAAMLAGYREAAGEIIIVMDADGSNDPREIPRFLRALMQGADFVKGSRFAPGGGTSDMPRIRRLGNAFFVVLANLLFNGTFTDLCYGYHAFWAYSLCTLDMEGIDGFEIDTALYLRAVSEKLKITEVPSFEGYRFYGYGKLRTIPDGFRVLETIIKEFFMHIFHPKGELKLGFNGEASQFSEVYKINRLEKSE